MVLCAGSCMMGCFSARQTLQQFYVTPGLVWYVSSTDITGMVVPFCDAVGMLGLTLCSAQMMDQHVAVAEIMCSCNFYTYASLIYCVQLMIDCNQLWQSAYCSVSFVLFITLCCSSLSSCVFVAVSDARCCTAGWLVSYCWTATWCCFTVIAWPITSQEVRRLMVWLFSVMQYSVLLQCDVMLACYMPSSYVCLSQVGVLLKWLNIGSQRQHHTIAQGL